MNKQKYRELVKFIMGGNVGMCLEYYFKVEPSPYPLFIAIIMIIMIIVDFFNQLNNN